MVAAPPRTSRAGWAPVAGARKLELAVFQWLVS
jgi:hypothetical protein